MAMRSVMAILMAAMSVLAFGQVRISVGPLVITPPSGYALSAQQKSDRVTFTSASPALQVIVSFGSLRGEDSWAALETVAARRPRALQQATESGGEPQRTRWLDLPALLFRTDTTVSGKPYHWMTLVAHDSARARYLQLEIGFAPENSKHVQGALKTWTKAVKYEPEEPAEIGAR